LPHSATMNHGHQADCHGGSVDPGLGLGDESKEEDVLGAIELKGVERIQPIRPKSKMGATLEPTP